MQGHSFFQRRHTENLVFPFDKTFTPILIVFLSYRENYRDIIGSTLMPL